MFDGHDESSKRDTNLLAPASELDIITTVLGLIELDGVWKCRRSGTRSFETWNCQLTRQFACCLKRANLIWQILVDDISLKVCVSDEISDYVNGCSDLVVLESSKTDQDHITDGDAHFATHLFSMDQLNGHTYIVKSEQTRPTLPQMWQSRFCPSKQ